MHGGDWHIIDMVFDTFAGLLRRPLTAPPAAVEAQPAKQAAARAIAPLLSADTEYRPVTLPELNAALADCFKQKQDAEILLEEIVFRREELLADDGLPLDEIDKLEAEAQNASRLIVRLDSIAEKLALKVRDLRRAENAVAFSTMRDAMVAQARELVPAFRAAANASVAWHKLQIEAATAFPGAAEFVPGLIPVSHQDVELFEAAIDVFARTMPGANPAASALSASDQIAAVLRGTAKPPAWDNMGGFPQVVDAALAEPRAVILTRSSTDVAGKRTRAGEELLLPYDQARALIDRGIARWKEEP